MDVGRVVVIGGGLAGISAALACSDAGRQVTLIESRNHLGGRVSSVTHPRQDWKIDNCQHACFRVYDRFLQLIARAKAQQSIKLQANTNLPFALPQKKAFSALTTGRLSPPNHMMGSMLAFPFLSLRDKLSMRKAIKSLSSMNDQQMWELDDILFIDWLKKNGQTDRAIERFWGFFVLAALNISIQEASAAQACMLFKKGLFGEADAFDVGAFTSDLSESIEPALSSALEKSGVIILRNSTVKGIELENNCITSVKTQDDNIQCSDVIIATPHHITSRILQQSIAAPNEQYSQQRKSIIENLCTDIASMKYRSLIGIHSFYRGNRVPQDFTFAAIIDEPLIQMIFNRNSELSHPLEEGVQWISVAVSAADPFLKMSDEEMLKQLDGVLQQLWPENEDIERFEHLIVRTPKATIATTPGSAKLRPTASILGSNIAIAGCWTRTKWPSTMEGAVRSGLNAAAHILDIQWDSDKPWQQWPLRPKRGDEEWPIW